MKHLFQVAMICCLSMLGFAAIGADAKTMQDPLVGKWTGSDTNSRGSEATTTFELKADATFTGTAEVNHRVAMSYSGTWALQGNELLWTYSKSSQPALKPGTVDIDVIESVNGNSLVLRSKMSGQRHHFIRQP